MTGIERLREVATRVEDGGCVSPGGECRREGGVTCRSCLADALYAIADQVERKKRRDQASDVSVSAYDLLPQEDREAVAWVREHGGIAYVKDAWNVRSNFDRQLERAQAKVERKQRHIEEIQAKLSERRDKINIMRAQIAEMRPRLMPEGMEWPKVDGKPVDFVTGYEPSLGVLEAVSIYNNGACEVMGHDGIIKNVNEIHVATPKVLDADGVEIRKGDTVWTLKDARELEVTGLYPEQDSCPVKVKEHKNGAYIFSGVDPSDLTHERPDSWERLEEDVASALCPDVYCANHRIDTSDTSYEWAMARDIVRRAKALAGVSE